MATFDTSSLNFDKLLDDEGDQVTHPDPSEHVSPDKDRERQIKQNNFDNLQEFADLIPAAPSDEVTDSNRIVAQRLREMDPEAYERFLNNEAETGQPKETAPQETPDTVTTTAKPSGFSRLLKRFGFGKDDAASAWIDVLERPLDRCAVIGFSSFKGGCGKTTLSSMVGTVIKRARPQDEVVVIDLDPSGNLANRAKGTQYADIQGYAKSIKSGNSDPSPFIMETVDGVHVIGSRIDQLDDELTATQIVRVIESLVEYYDFVVVDMPQRTDSRQYAALLHMLDVITFVFEAKNDAIRSVDAVVPVLQRSGADYLVDRRVIAFNHTSIVGSKAEHFDSADVVHRLIHDEGVEVLELPYDDYLRNAGVLDGSNLPQKKYRQFIQLSAAIVNSVENVRSVERLSVRKK